jgi:hypothetical protein
MFTQAFNPGFAENLEKIGAEIYEVASAYADGEWPSLKELMLGGWE